MNSVIPSRRIRKGLKARFGGRARNFRVAASEQSHSAGFCRSFHRLLLERSSFRTQSSTQSAWQKKENIALA
jgi:hypothetical protein